MGRTLGSHTKNTEERPGARQRAIEGGQKIMNFKKFKQKALENPEVRREYNALQDEFSLIDQLITMRTKAGLTQEDVAKKRSEEHTSELQSRPHLVCRLLLEKKKKI